ncbi:hypothetical protein D3C85_540710 [compost metagenome]
MRVLQDAILDLPGPELTGDLEGFIDFNGLGDLDVAVLVLRRVVQFGQGGVAGTGVVPAVGAFQGDAIETLDHFHRHARLEFIEPDAQCRTHDAATDQQDIDFLGFGCMHRHKGHRHGQAE